MVISPSSGTMLRPTRCAVLIPDVAQFLLDDGEDALLLREDVEQIFDRLDKFLVFGLRSCRAPGR